MRTIAISDIHGHNKTFNALLDMISLTKEDNLVILGDCIDRGFYSKDVLDTILHLQQGGYNVKCLMGNHEQMLLRSYHDSREFSLWEINGGDQTLLSFGLTDVRDLPHIYVNFLEQLDYHYETENVILVHAGLNMNDDDPLKDNHAKIWIYDWYDYIDYRWLDKRKIIHGHVIQSRYEIERGLDRLDAFPVLSIDNGCFIKMQSYNHLCALDLTNRKLYFSKNIG